MKTTSSHAHSYIIAAKRTAVVPRGGAFAEMDIHQLSAPVVQTLLSDTNSDPLMVNEVIAANALGAGGNPARLIALASGLPEYVGGLSIDRQCCGGLDAVLIASDMVLSGRASRVIAGGAESYSRRPKRLRRQPESGEWEAYDQPPFTPWPEKDPLMSEAANELAKQCRIGKAQQDAWAIDSHHKALQAEACLRSEIISVADTCQDPFTRKVTDRLCRRSPVITGSISAANAAVAADGAAFCMVVDEQQAKHHRGPKLRILSGSTQGADPRLPGLAPVSAINSALASAGITAKDLTCAEIMEAYAVQAIACIENTDIDPAICNVGGGALSRGHPIGASGAVLLTRLFTELQSRHGLGLAAIAAAGGLGTAIVVEYVDAS